MSLQRATNIPSPRSLQQHSLLETVSPVPMETTSPELLDVSSGDDGVDDGYAMAVVLYIPPADEDDGK